MDADVVIRAACPADGADIHRIELACFSTPWSLTAVESELAYESGVTLVACAGGSAVGYVSLRHVADEGYMNNLAVLPEYRGRGLARGLMTSLVSRCRELGLAFLTLEVREGNTAAKQLYSALGFTPVGRRKRFYRDPEEDALLYTLTLKERE